MHARDPYRFFVDGEEHRVAYVPGESDSGLFGGNSNWRGPVWFPMNYLLIEALERYHHFYGDGLTVECPTGSGRRMNLGEVARRARRTARPPSSCPTRTAAGRATATTGATPRIPHCKDLVLFHEYFHGDTGRGLGASHQTGWTALAVRLIEHLPRRRSAQVEGGGC